MASITETQLRKRQVARDTLEAIIEAAEDALGVLEAGQIPHADLIPLAHRFGRATEALEILDALEDSIT